LTSLLKKLFELSIWNSTAAAINFLSNILIVTIFGLHSFGDLAYISSLSGIFSIFFLVLPSNFSLIRYQEDPDYKYIFSSFYLYASLILLGLAFLFAYLVDIPAWLLFLFSWSLIMQSYFDIRYQAENSLKSYYQLLFFLALFKIILLGVYYLLNYSPSLFNLVLLLSLSRILIFLGILIYLSKDFYHSFFFIRKSFQLIWRERKLLSTYYLTSGLQRINSNILVLLIGPVVGSEITGIYALLLKIYQFMIGLIRTLESLLLNKISHSKFEHAFPSSVLPISIIAQILYVGIGAAYMYYLTQESYIYQVIACSFLVYFYVRFVKARSFFLVNYNNNPIIIALIISLITSLGFILYINLTEVENGLNLFIAAFISAAVLQMLYLIFREN
jgi:hypothetical protein